VSFFIDILLNINLLEYLEVILISTVKFFFAPIFALRFGFSIYESILTTTIGGFLGILVFYYSSSFITHLFGKFIYLEKDQLKSKKNNYYLKSKQRLGNKKVFSKKNKFIIRTRNRYGLAGIVILTPVLLSIPLGAFLANKYFSNRKYTLHYLLLSVLLWSVILSLFYHIV